MKISINGETAETSAKTLAELAKELGLPERGVAVAAENRVVPRAEWAAARPTRRGCAFPPRRKT